MTPQEREAAQMALDALSMAVEPKKGEVYAFEFQPIDCAAMHLKAIDALRAALAQPEQEPWGYISHRSWKMPVFVEADDLEVSGLPFNNPNYTPVYKAPPQREWQNAALRLGEELSTVGPDGYYNMSASEWLDWAMNHITPARIEQEPPCKTGSQCVGGKCERCAVQEPVAWSVTYHGIHCNNMFSDQILAENELRRLDEEYGSAARTIVPLYDAPPQRKWHGLTNEETSDLIWKSDYEPRKIARAIEAKLRNKNV